MNSGIDISIADIVKKTDKPKYKYSRQSKKIK